MEVGQISFGVRFDENSIEESLQKLRGKFESANRDFTLKTATDERALTGLNKHLDKKKQHLSEINDYFKSNPIRPEFKVDREQAKRDVQDTVDVAFKAAGFSVKFKVDKEDFFRQIQSIFDKTVKVNVDSDVRTSSSSGSTSVDNQARQAEESVKRIETAIKKASAFNPFKSIATGFFENIGGGVSGQIVKGVQRAAKNNFGVDLANITEQLFKKKSSSTSRNASDYASSSGSAEWASHISAINPVNNRQLALPPSSSNVGIGINAHIPKSEEIVMSAKKSMTVATNQANFTRSFAASVDQSLANIRAEATKAKPDIEAAKSEFNRIKESFKKAYSKLREAVKANNKDFAAILAQSIIQSADKAHHDINAITRQLEQSGENGSFGSALKNAAGSTKGIITRNYVKPSQRALNAIQNAQANEQQGNQFVDLGKQVVAGTAKGLTDHSAVIRESNEVALAILDAMRKSLGIQSPSKKAFQLMGFVGQGFVLGAKAVVGSVRGAGEMLADAVLPTASRVKQGARNKAKQMFPNLVPDNAAEAKAKEEALKNTLVDPLGMDMMQEGFRNPKKGLQNLMNWRQTIKPKLPDDAGSRQYFERLITLGANKVISLSEKEYGKKEGASVAKQAGAAAVLTAFPKFGAAALASPLAMPLLPSIMGYKEAAMLLTPVVNKLKDALEQVTPINQKLANLAGSEVGGRQELSYVKGVSGRTGTNIESAASAYTGISFATKGTKLEGEETKHIFEGIASASKYVGASAAESSLIFQAFQQIISKGKLSMEELRQQLSEKFPPAMQVFAEALGVSVPQMQEMISKGAVLSEDILPKVADVLTKKFGKSTTSAANDFVMATTRMQNASFEFSQKLVDAFGGIYTAVLNLGAGIAEKFLGEFGNIQKVFNVVVISLTATAAAGFQTILSTKSLAPKLAIVQNLFVATFRKTFSMLTPMAAGIFIDLVDDMLGAKNSVMDNMSKGVSNMFVSAFTEADNLFRQAMSGKSMFAVEFGDGGGNMFSGITDTLAGFFKIIPSGLVEMGALVLMFQQCALLAKAYLMPSLSSTGKALSEMVKGIGNAVANLGNIKDAMHDFFPAILNGAKSAFGAVLGFAANAAAALAVMAFAQGDFSDPLAAEMNKSRKRIIDDIGGIKKSFETLKSVGVETANSISTAFSNIDLAKSLTSKGVELNVKKILGLADESESYKTDDLIKDLNNPKSDNLLTKFIRLFPTDPDVEFAESRKLKKQADKLGIGKFFKEDEYITLGQKQLFNKASDVNRFDEQLTSQLTSLNLTPSTIKNLASGQMGEQIKTIQQYDRMLEQLGNKRVKLALIDTSDSRKQVRQIDADVKTILADRKKLQKPLGEGFSLLEDSGKEIQTQIDAIKKSDLPMEARKALLAPLEEQKKGIDDTIAYIKSSGLSKVAEPLQEIWSGVVDKLRDADALFERLSNQQKVEDINKQADIYSKNLGADATKTSLDVNNIDNLTNVQKGLEAVLETRKKALERILAISDIETNETRKKEVEDLKKNITTDTLNLAQTKQQIAQAQNEMFNRLKEQGKQVQEYFDSIDNAAKEKAIEFKKLQNVLKADTKQSKIRDILSDGYDTAISQFLESYSSVLDKQTEIANKKLEAEGAALKSKQDLKTQVKQGDELLKSLATDGIEIKLDTSALRNDINVEVLNKKLGESVDSVGNLKGKLNETENAVDQNTQSVSELYAQLAKIPEQLDIAKQKIDGNNTAIKTWNESLTGSLGLLTSINGSLTGMGATIASNTAKASEMMGILATPTSLGEAAIQNAGKVGDGLSKLGTNDPQNNPNVFGMLGNLMQGKGVYGGGGLNRPQINSLPLQAIESISGRKVTAGRTTADIEVHHPSRGNSRESLSRDYQMIDGKLEEVNRGKGGTPLIIKDMVLSRNGNKNIQIPSPASGYVSRVGDGVGRVRLADKDGNMLADVLHLTGIKVKKGDYVQYGQELGQQGGMGKNGANTYAQHLHASMSKEMWSNYIRDFNDGGYDTNTANCQLCGATNHNKKQHEQLGNNNFTQAVKKGGLTTGFVGGGSTKNIDKLQSYRVVDVATGQVVKEKNSTIAPASPASTIKVVIGDLAVKNLKNDQMVNIGADQIAEGDSSKYKSGTKLSVATLMRRMLDDSDNTATNALIGALGGTKRATAMANQAGYTGTKINNYLSTPGASGFTNISTAKDTTMAMLSLLKSNSPEGKIAQSAVRANDDFGFKGEAGGKIGNNSKIIGDVGIVRSNGKEYIITTYAEYNGNIESNRKIITNATNDLSKSLTASTSSRINESSSNTDLTPNIVKNLTPISTLALKFSSTERGEASFYREAKYDKYNSGTHTANGDYYDENKDTAAIDSKRRDKLNTVARVTNQKTGQSRFVRITDTGIFGSSKFNRRIIDLSKGAAERIGITAKQGVGQVQTDFLPGKVPKGKAGDDYVAMLNAKYGNIGKQSLIQTSIKEADAAKDRTQKTTSSTTKKDSSTKRTAPTKGKNEDQFRREPILDVNSKGKNEDQFRRESILDEGLKEKPGLSTSGLRVQVKKAQAQAQATDAQEQLRIKQQTDLDNKRLADEAKREKNKAIKTLDDYSRELGLDFKTTQRTIQDKEFDAIPYPTLEQKKDKEIRDARRSSADNRSDILKKKRDIEKPIEQAKKMLEQVDLPLDMRASAQKTLNQLMTVEKGYTLLLNKNNELELKNVDAIEKRYAREQDLKNQKEKMEDKQLSLSNLQKEIEKLEQLKSINPYDKRIRELPKLKEEANLLENTLQYQQNLIDLEEADHNELNNESYKKRLDLLKEQVESRRDAIKLTRVQEEREQALADMKRQREQDSRFLGLDNQIKKPLTRRPDVQYDVTVSEANNNLQNAYLDIEERKYENPLDALRERSKNAQIFLQQRDQAALDRDTSKVQFQQDDYDFFKQPGYDAENKRAERLRASGREFRGNEISRKVGAAQEEFRYKQQLLQLENQLADRRAKGVIDSAGEIDNLKQSLEDLHKINLADLDDQFKTFGRTIDDVTKQALGGLGNSIADLIVDGGDLGETLSGVFNNILKSFISTGINTGVNSLMSGLFGGKGGGAQGSAMGIFSGLFGGGSSSGGIGSLFGSSGLGSIFGSIGSIFGLKQGGMVPGYSSGGDIRYSDTPIGAALREEGHNSILATLTPNERVLTVDEAKVYNSLYPNGILNRMKPPGFSDGGMVEPSSIGQTIAKSSSINVGVTANIEDSGGSMKEKQLISLIRTVVTAELNRQKAPGGILSN